MDRLEALAIKAQEIRRTRAKLDALRAERDAMLEEAVEFHPAHEIASRCRVSHSLIAAAKQKTKIPAR